MTYSQQHLNEAAAIIGKLDVDSIERTAALLADLRQRHGRLFLLGVGGSAANCSHAVNDFRKICGVEAYTPTDNVSELTARINDDGWASAFANWQRQPHWQRRRRAGVFGRRRPCRKEHLGEYRGSAEARQILRRKNHR